MRRASDLWSSLGKSSALISRCVANALNVGSSSSKSPSVCSKKAKKPRRASGSKGEKKAAEGPSRDNANIDVNRVQAEVRQVSFVT